MIASLPIALLGIAVMAVIAVRANRRFSDHERLPMQFWLDGTPTWTLPRKYGVAFIPVVGSVILLAVATAIAFGPPPRAGQEDFVLPVIVLFPIGMIAIQIFHLWLVERHFRTK
jgi:hypothetical protein